MTKAYIAGKITGVKDYKAKFERATLILESAGYKVMNPAVLPEGFEFEEYMKICFAMIDVCDVVYMLGNWKSSAGANLEHLYAKATRKSILYQDTNNL
jgi:hypothetical protein